MTKTATGTVLAFDFGEKFTGVAVGETSVGVAHPLGLIAAQGSAARMDEAAELVAEWKPRTLVVGLPLSFDRRRPHPVGDSPGLGEAGKEGRGSF